MKKLAFLISSALLVTACGGGGSGDGASSTGGGSGSGGSTAAKTKITNNSADGMINGANKVDPNAARNVAGNVGNQGASGAARSAMALSARAASNINDTIACYNGNGNITTKASGNEQSTTGTFTIDRCSLSDDLNIRANGKLNFSVADSKLSISGFFNLEDENKAEKIIALNDLAFNLNGSNTSFSSLVSAGGETHGIAINHIVSDNSGSTTTLKLDGAEGTWVQVNRVTNVWDQEVSCEVTQSAGLDFTQDEGCDLLRK
ncbi:hypothetical protein Q8W40_10030 [Vibrio penaeicida]|uniref:hypothetical protein n=1 Tax=Vibrio penaeicida TaxID=104609 RepID=UPI00273430CE|nr:hypothetical protein [Vibrio penaeicida]MDP2572518.1 hypothetical protein [Vibrio penaeicida]